MPPTPSIASAIRRGFGQRWLPLNNICSMKCEIPQIGRSSWPEPTPTKAPSEIEWVCGSSSTRTRRPLGRVRVCSIMFRSIHYLQIQQGNLERRSLSNNLYFTVVVGGEAAHHHGKKEYSGRLCRPEPHHGIRCARMYYTPKCGRMGTAALPQRR